MFQRKIGDQIQEVSHKRIDRPQRNVYFNHIHNHCELLLFLSGHAEYNIDGQTFKPAPYDLLFIPAATYHYLIPYETAPYENYVIGIDPELIDRSHYQKLFSAPLMINIQDDAELRGFFSRLDFYHGHYSEADFDESAAALLRELFVYCSYRKDVLSSGHSAPTHPYINEIVSYISQNIEQPLDADTIARKFLLSKSYVQNMFSQHMHIGLKKYIMQKKIYAAHNDILLGASPLAVCETYSFGDYSSFYRLYRQTFGTSPKEKK